jgi:predicted transposase YbfD/YdcC
MPFSLPQPLVPIAPSALQVLVERFRDVPDFRCGNANQIHLLVDVLVTSICAVLGGANSWLSVARFGVTHQAWFHTFLELPNGIPSHDTYRQIFLHLAPSELNQRFATWMKDISHHLKLKQIAFDGKTLCGSGNGRTGLPALHMVHAFAVDNGICLAQQAVDAKSNEITAIPQLLKLLDLQGALVTIDALGCQKEIAAGIVDGGGDYVLVAKGNQERLRDDVQTTMATAMQNPAAGEAVTFAQTHEDNRGRGEKRTGYVTTKLSAIRDRKLWKGLLAVGVIISERTIDGIVEVEQRHYICSRVLAAEQLLQCVRNHWYIENGLHWVLDVVFGEDGHQLRVGHGAANFTTLRKLAHAFIKNRQPKHGIKGTREMAGWNTAILEEIIHDAVLSREK